MPKKKLTALLDFYIVCESGTRPGYHGVVTGRRPGAHLSCDKSSFYQHLDCVKLTSLTNTLSPYSSSVFSGTVREWQFDLLRTEGLLEHGCRSQA